MYKAADGQASISLKVLGGKLAPKLVYYVLGKELLHCRETTQALTLAGFIVGQCCGSCGGGGDGFVLLCGAVAGGGGAGGAGGRRRLADPGGGAHSTHGGSTGGIC